MEYLLRRTKLSPHQSGLLKLSLALNEFAPAASFNGSTTTHNCSISDTYEHVYTDFRSPYDYNQRTIVRYLKLPVDKTVRRTFTGYGAHLALKRTDYLVIDDSNPAAGQVSADSRKLEPLNKDKMSNIGMRAVSRIIKSENPLEELEDVSQNFPMRATTLLGSKVSKELKDELKELRNIVKGDIFMINGISLDPTPGKLLPVLRAESILSSELQALGMNVSQVVNFLTFDLELPPKIDRFDVRSPAVTYLNDFESDALYHDWPASLETFMRPLYPGQFHTIRRNAHTVILQADLTSAKDRELISNFAMFVQRGLPLRWGVVPSVDTEKQAQLAKTWKALLVSTDAATAAEYLEAVVESDNIAQVYRTWHKKLGGGLPEYDDLEAYEHAQDWIDRFGGNSMYANGRPVENDDKMMQRISAYLRDDTMMIQETMIEGGIADTGDLQDFWMGPRPRPKYSKALFGAKTYMSMRELQSVDFGGCHKDFQIVLWGEDWPFDTKTQQDPCIVQKDGPRRMAVNGRIIESLDHSELPSLIAQEEEELAKYRAAALRAEAPMSPRILSIIRTTSAVRTILPVMKSKITYFTIGQESQCTLSVHVYVDPLSENAQKWSTILKTLSKITDIYIKVQLVPQFNINELPLKRFYRYLLPAEPSFVEESIEFDDLPSDLMVFSLDVWSSWVTSPLYAAVDLDNLHLGSTPYRADFEVSDILVEGHAKEVGNSGPPRGAQLTLSNTDGDEVETIIMANLGYFQFKARPGVWTLQTKHGRTSEVYDLTPTDIDVVSWAGTTVFPKLARKSGQETTEVLDDKQVAGLGGIWSKLKGFSGKELKSVKRHADINIFTVASGHLYERFVYIMISSVMAHTEHSVKFWFISNFLSPQFRQFIPHLAAHLGFEYEMITFTWPHWLRQQTEKQRIIWGYKILFLDVMFPLDLEKVIFVDADQIVRTDMINLINEDLKGKVWGYTPMCDSRKEIEGFRFWKKGYWKDFLKGKPYHISALYVIDLVAFRAQATGDRLRQQYHQLSADPGSLSNLDQDLPNHLQAQIPIHSLSQEWLWCETWCSDESLKDAKTIDLCQNPMTKEPKLDRARRQLPEWNEYDAKIREFAKSIATVDSEDEIGSIVVDVDSVGQNLEMKRDQLGDDNDPSLALTQTTKVPDAHERDEL